GGGEGPRPALERIDAGAPLRASCERGPAGGSHPSRPDQAPDMRDVDPAPDALLSARGEADAEADVIHPAPDPIDPTEAKRLIESLGVGDSLVRGVRLEAAQEQLGLGSVVLLQPGPEGSRRGKRTQGP